MTSIVSDVTIIWYHHGHGFHMMVAYNPMRRYQYRDNDKDGTKLLEIEITIKPEFI